MAMGVSAGILKCVPRGLVDCRNVMPGSAQGHRRSPLRFVNRTNDDRGSLIIAQIPALVINSPLPAYQGPSLNPVPRTWGSASAGGFAEAQHVAPLSLGEGVAGGFADCATAARGFLRGF